MNGFSYCNDAWSSSPEKILGDSWSPRGWSLKVYDQQTGVRTGYSSGGVLSSTFGSVRGCFHEWNESSAFECVKLAFPAEPSPEYECYCWVSTTVAQYTMPGTKDSRVLTTGGDLKPTCTVLKWESGYDPNSVSSEVQYCCREGHQTTSSVGDY